jgi:hypothetical protein
VQVYQPSTQKEFSAAVSVANQGDWVRLSAGCVWELQRSGWSPAGYAATLRKSVALDNYCFVRNFENLFPEKLGLLQDESAFEILGVRYEPHAIANGKVELRKSVPLTGSSGVSGPCPPLGSFLDQAFGVGGFALRKAFALPGTISAII